MPVTDQPPPGKLRQTVSYLEMTAPPTDVAGRRIAEPGCRLEPPALLSPADYRGLQRAVGEPWLWWERLALGEAELAAIIHDPLVEVRRLRGSDAILGFSEIDRRPSPGTCAGDVGITFLGLVPEAIGRGLGRLLLAATLQAAWTHPARRIWLHTCDHDHPKALALYQSAGFRITGVQAFDVPDPRLLGLLPRTAAPHVPLAQRAPTPFVLLPDCLLL